jgi:hypothetical protein
MSLNSPRRFVFVMEMEGVCCELGIIFLSIIYITQTSQSIVNKQCDLPVRDCVIRWASMDTDSPWFPLSQSHVGLQGRHTAWFVSDVTPDVSIQSHLRCWRVHTFDTAANSKFALERTKRP